MLLARSAEMLSAQSAETFSLGSTDTVQIISSPIVQYRNKLQKKISKQTVNSNVSGSKIDIVWRMVIVFTILHLGALYGVWLLFTQAMWSTYIMYYIYGLLAGLGITAGAHRLWSHRTYKAKLPLSIFLMLCQSAALQNSIYEWTRDHRVHHKFTDTNADPHNALRGFFFSHMGWLMVKKHEDVITKGKAVDLRDLEADSVVMFQKRYYWPLALLFCFFIPIFTPWYFWGENFLVSLCATGLTRYVHSLHFTWLVNSAAHLWGTRPYDTTINPRENRFVAWAAFGEGWHNYHHVFPWDYKAAELGNYRLNLTTGFLDFMAKLGWAYDLKTVSPEMVMKRVQRTGSGNLKENNGSRISNDIVGHNHHHTHGDHLWGWGDQDMNQDEIKDVKIYNKLTE